MNFKIHYIDGIFSLSLQPCRSEIHSHHKNSLEPIERLANPMLTTIYLKKKISLITIIELILTDPFLNGIPSFKSYFIRFEFASLQHYIYVNLNYSTISICASPPLRIVFYTALNAVHAVLLPVSISVIIFISRSHLSLIFSWK